MIYGNYVINAEQAAELTGKAIKRIHRNERSFIQSQMNADADNVNIAIESAAKKGLTETSCWIMFQSTYETLVKNGYIVSGGRLGESVPPRLSSMWGQQKDKFHIAWGTSLDSINTEEIECDPISPLLRSPNRDMIDTPAEEKASSEKQEIKIKIDSQSESETHMHTIYYKLVGSDSDLFETGSHYVFGKIDGGQYPTAFEEGELVDISNLRYYFHGKKDHFYRFKGWYLDREKTKKFSGSFIGGNADIVLYADISPI